MMTETKQWQMYAEGEVYFYTNDMPQGEVRSKTMLDRLNALEACADALRRTLDSHGCIDCQETGSCARHGIANLYDEVKAAKAAIARLDTLLQDNVDDK